MDDFSYIGVRDTSTEYVVSGLSKKSFFHNCDPTTLIDKEFLKEYAEKVKVKFNIPKDRVVVGVMTAKEEVGYLAKNIFKDEAYCISLYTPNVF